MSAGTFSKTSRIVTALSKIVEDLRPSHERWIFAARIALSGLLIIAVQMTLRMEILYPAMSVMLITTEMRGTGTVTRFLVNVLGATFGCAAAVALGALFIQQPWFLLSGLWMYIVIIIYFMGSSGYRSAIFVAGYPLIVITFMSFFDKTHVENIAIMVYKSCLIGLCCSSAVTIFIFPSRPLVYLQDSLINCFGRSNRLLERMMDAAKNRVAFDVKSLSQELATANTTVDVDKIERAQIDHSFSAQDKADLLSLLAYGHHCEITLHLLARQMGLSAHPAPVEVVEILESVHAKFERLAKRLEQSSPDDEHDLNEHDLNEPAPPAAVKSALQQFDPSFAAAIASLETTAAHSNDYNQKIDKLKSLQHTIDFGTTALVNLRQLLSNLFRQSLNPLNTNALRHAIKCSTSILICALVCITLNWNQGIGCVESVMLVVQLTLGGTFIIGFLRFSGVLIGFTLAILAIIFILPTVTTLPSFLMLFAPVLFCAGYAMHGSLRVSTIGLQVMIVFDFALLQFTGPDISLLPAMNFALAVAMGIGVTFLVYRFLWRVQSGDLLNPALAEMLEVTAALLSQSVKTSVSIADLERIALRLDAIAARCMELQNAAQYDSTTRMSDWELRLRAAIETERFTQRALQIFSHRFVAQELPPQLANLATVAAENLRRCAIMLRTRAVDCELMLAPSINITEFPHGECLTQPSGEIVALRDLYLQLNAILIDRQKSAEHATSHAKNHAKSPTPTPMPSATR